jgi:RHS repeat-associated protein
MGVTKALVYGADNRLKTVDVGVTYWHNAEGQRVIARNDKGIRHFVYDINDRLIAEADADGRLIREYFYLDRVPVAMRDAANDQLYFVHGDHLGTPKLVTDAAGDVVWSGEALAFGATRVSGPLAMDFRFPGQIEDGVTGYFYNYHRDYDATVGRYLQSDPIGLKAGVNTYGYVSGNPVVRFDSNGLAWLRPDCKPPAFSARH